MQLPAKENRVARKNAASAKGINRLAMLVVMLPQTRQKRLRIESPKMVMSVRVGVV
jgi:hypothetical protein